MFSRAPQNGFHFSLHSFPLLLAERGRGKCLVQSVYSSKEFFVKLKKKKLFLSRLKMFYSLVKTLKKNIESYSNTNWPEHTRR